ncbi:hypothetical protein B0T18DRAFT_241489 [Schizothecium vesticola]|uniref:Secreted protein n=1 Tax=Schizothecium vesticola TaxID=314040 RepID=A0AA40BPZ8_9PEZI|nr:hypothetical protein B0T18DRAFT_241489 [Schizothecium vesticola]
METVSIALLVCFACFGRSTLAATVVSTHIQNHHDVEVYSGWTRCKSNAEMIMWILVCETMYVIPDMALQCQSKGGREGYTALTTRLARSGYFSKAFFSAWWSRC